MPIQFEALPVDVLLHVFRELDINDIVLLRKVCPFGMIDTWRTLR